MKQKQNLSWVLVVSLLLSLVFSQGVFVDTIQAQTVTSSGIYYVATNGDDANTCAMAQNINTPKRTLNSALLCLQAGATLYIREGTYSEALQNIIPSGTSWTNPVTIAAYSAETAILKPIGTEHVLPFKNGEQYIEIDGLNLDASGVLSEAIKITSAHHIRIKNTEVKNSKVNGILANGTTGYNEFINLKVHDNSTTDNSALTGHGIFVSNSYNLIENSEIYNNAGWGIHLYPLPASNNVIRNNRVHDNARVGNRGPGIGIYGPNNIAYNNIVWNNKTGFQIYYNADNNKIFNNTVYNDDRGIDIYDSHGVIVTNNIVYQNSGGSIIDTGNSAPIKSNNLENIDPKFVNAGGLDFHLQSTSPAINAGATISEVPYDIQGVTRPMGVAYDIGAYEYSGTTVSPTPTPSPTPPPTTTTTTTTTIPPVPTNLTATLYSSSNQINLNWQDSSNLETEFKVYNRLQGAVTWNHIKSVSQNSVSVTYTYESASIIRIMEFAVAACNSLGCSNYSNIASVTIPAITSLTTSPTNSTTTDSSSTTSTTTQTELPIPHAPSDLTVVANSTGVSLSWKDNSSNEASFKIFMYSSGGSWTQIANVYFNVTTYIYTTVLSSTAGFKLVACNASGCSAESNIATVTPTISTLVQKNISGTIIFNDNSPVTDAQVIAFLNATQSYVYGSTDSNGNYSISLPTGGDYTVGLRPINLNNSTWSFSGTIGAVSFKTDSTTETKNLNYTLNKDSLNLNVFAKNSSGQPLANAYITFDNSTGVTIPAAKTDSFGKATFTLPRGSYIVRANIDPSLGYINPPQQSLSVNQTGSKDMIFVFNKPTETTLVNLTGTVKFDTSIPVDAYVWAWAESGESLSARANSDGTFSFKVRPSTTWHIGAGKKKDDSAYKSAEAVVSVGSLDASQNLVLGKAVALPATVIHKASSTSKINAKATDGAEVTVPANSAPTAGDLTLQIDPTVEAPHQPAKIPVSNTYDVTLKDAAGNKVTTFTSLLEVRIPYDKTNIKSLGIDENLLKPSYFDDQTATWIEISDFTVNTANSQVIARVNHLTRFAIVMPADIVPPLPPSNWGSVTSDAIAVLLSWVNPDKDFKYVKIYRSDSTDNLGQLVATDITVSTYADPGLIAGKSYYYVLRAVDPAGNESTNKNPMWVKAISGSVSPLPGTPYYKGPTPLPQPLSTQIVKDLKYGSRGSEVRKLQQVLYSQGLLRVKPTGYFGKLTKQAVIDFQNKYWAEALAPDDLAQATGIVKGATKNKINALLASS